MELVDGYEFDNRFQAQDGSPLDITIAGVDEAGRGPLAGPVVAAAVILASHPRIVGLRDSKVVPAQKREALYYEIQKKALAWEVAVVEPVVIDSINILQATMLAMRQCIEKIRIRPNLVLVDGNRKPGSASREEAIVKGDGKSASIMAASIIAKVTRDKIMEVAHAQYPLYGFDVHKGYGTARHLRAIEKYGPCPIHRQSFQPIRVLACR